MTEIDQPLLVDLKWLIPHLGQSRRWFMEHMRLGTFPPPDMRLGNKLKWYGATIREWLKKQEA